MYYKSDTKTAAGSPWKVTPHFSTSQHHICKDSTLHNGKASQRHSVTVSAHHSTDVIIHNYSKNISKIIVDKHHIIVVQ